MTSFHLLSGAGNDFLALAEPERLPAAAEIRAWCRRGLSIGADGLFVLRRSTGSATAEARRPTIRMEYWNADGRPADLCLNGTRCAARLAFALGWARERLQIATPVATVGAVEVDASTVRLEEAPLPAEQPRPLALDSRQGFKVVVGVPHFVLEVPDIEAAPVSSLGARLRRDAAFGEAGTNVDFVATSSPSLLLLRTYERGVEAETLACGTGVLAAVAVGLCERRLRLPVTVRTRGGFELEVAGEEHDGVIVRWSLSGDARLVARGEIFSAAATEPRSAPTESAASSSA